MKNAAKPENDDFSDDDFSDDDFSDDDFSDDDSGPDVLFINKGTQQAVLTDHTIVPITHWFDGRGEDCHPLKAATCVAGTEETGWFVVDLIKYEYATMH